MKKLLISLLMTFSIALFGNNIAKDIAVFFNSAQEATSELSLKIAIFEKRKLLSQDQLAYGKTYLQNLKIINLIANRDIENLKKINFKQLNQPFQLWIKGEKFADNMRGCLDSRSIYGENMLAYVLLHSATNKTKVDNKKTLKIMKIFLDKGLKPDRKISRSSWIKNKPSDTGARNYTSSFSFVEAALIYSSPEALELLLQSGAKFSKEKVTMLINQTKRPNIEDFKKVLNKYKHQSYSTDKF